MALDKTGLKNTIVGILTDMATRDESNNEADVVDEFATRLSDAIDIYVKTAKINYTTGLTAGATLVTGTFNGSLS